MAQKKWRRFKLEKQRFLDRLRLANALMDKGRVCLEWKQKDRAMQEEFFVQEVLHLPSSEKHSVQTFSFIGCKVTIDTVRTKILYDFIREEGWISIRDMCFD